MNVAYVRVPGNQPGQRIGIVTFNESGYHVTTYDLPSYTNEHVDGMVNRLNERINVSPEVSEAMLAGSMFGWDVPLAKAARDHFAPETHGFGIETDQEPDENGHTFTRV